MFVHLASAAISRSAQYVAESDARADMQVVDIYRREGDKIAENWVIIDIPYWLNQLGIDVFDCIRNEVV